MEVIHNHYHTVLRHAWIQMQNKSSNFQKDFVTFDELLNKA